MDHAERTERRQASATDGPQERSFGLDADAGGPMLERREPRPQGFVAGSDLDGQGPLGGSRQHEVEAEPGMVRHRDPEPIESGGGEHQAVELAGLQAGEPRLDVAAHRSRDEVRSGGSQLGRTSG